jgi:pimeloyl-ACP methyl ester carboxylesterase
VHSHVDFIHEFATALGLDRFHLAGNSMGCMNTTNYVVAHPERVLSFALIAGEVGDIVPDGRKPPAKVEMMRYDGTRDGMRAMMAAIIFRGEAVSDDLIEMRYLASERQRESHAHFWPSILEYGRVTPWRNPNIGARLSTRAGWTS